MMPDKKIIYESPYVTADTVIFTIQPVRTPLLINNGDTYNNGSHRVHENTLKVLLIKRTNPPFAGYHALPGVFLLKDENAEGAALRALREKAGIRVGYLEQLYTFDSRHRDPRGHTVSITYFALVPENSLKIRRKRASLQSPELFPVNKILRQSAGQLRIAFDHKEIIELALMRLRAKLEYTNIVYSLLPRYFALSDLQQAYEIIFGRKLDKRNFRKKFLSLELIRPTGKMLKGMRSRPAKLYEFKSRKLSSLKKFF